LLLAWLFRQGVPPHVTYLFKQASSRIARSIFNLFRQGDSEVFNLLISRIGKD
jgi:hypothetical protein